MAKPVAHRLAHLTGAHTFLYIDARRVLCAFASRATQPRASTTVQTSYFTELPLELLLAVFKRLKPIEVFHLSRTCQLVNACAHDNPEVVQTHLEEIAFMRIDKCVTFCYELSCALLLAKYIKNHNIHKFDTSPARRPYFTALERGVAAGAVRPTFKSIARLPNDTCLMPSRIDTVSPSSAIVFRLVEEPTIRLQFVVEIQVRQTHTCRRSEPPITVVREPVGCWITKHHFESTSKTWYPKIELDASWGQDGLSASFGGQKTPAVKVWIRC